MKVNKRSTLLVSVFCLVVSVGLVATATAANKAATTVTIAAKGTDLSGTVKSKKKKCKKNRKIVVYKQAGKSQAPKKDQKIGSDTASKQKSKFVWSTGNTGVTGILYARAAAKKGCKTSSSASIRVKPSKHDKPDKGGHKPGKSK